MKKNKFLSFILAICMFVPFSFALTGCFGGPDTPAHTQVWQNAWSTDEDYHWHACSGCDDVKDKASHTLSDDECTICGYEDTTTPVDPVEPVEPVNPVDPDDKTNEKEDQGEEKDDQGDQKEDQGDQGDKEEDKGDDKGDEEKKVVNKYEDVVDLIIDKCTNIGEYKITDVLMIDVDENGTLLWWARNEDSQVSKYKLDEYFKIEKTEEINEIAAIKNALTHPEITVCDFFLLDTYTADKTYTIGEIDSEDKTVVDNNNLIEALTKTLVGEGYEILAGGASNLSTAGVAPLIGNYSVFTVDLLLEKDGKIYEYHDYIMASNDLYEYFETPYNAVIDKIANEDVTYHKQGKLKELGSLAVDYRSEVKKVEEAEANKETR